MHKCSSNASLYKREIEIPTVGACGQACTSSSTRFSRPVTGLTRWRMTISYMDAAAELGRNPVSKNQIQPEYGNEQADAGRDD